MKLRGKLPGLSYTPKLRIAICLKIYMNEEKTVENDKEQSSFAEGERGHNLLKKREENTNSYTFLNVSQW